MAVELPDEILSKIAKACVDPWMLRYFRGPLHKDELRIDHIMFSGKADDERFHRYRYRRLPRLTNLKLVNTLFYNATWSAVRAQFDGTLSIE